MFLFLIQATEQKILSPDYSIKVAVGAQKRSCYIWKAKESKKRFQGKDKRTAWAKLVRNSLGLLGRRVFRRPGDEPKEANLLNLLLRSLDLYASVSQNVFLEILAMRV